jgi:hypothetical protein
MRKRGWQFDVEWFNRRWPFFAVGLRGSEFVLCLWLIEVSIWKL